MDNDNDLDRSREYLSFVVLFWLNKPNPKIPPQTLKICKTRVCPPKPPQTLVSHILRPFYLYPSFSSYSQRVLYKTNNKEKQKITISISIISYYLSYLYQGESIKGLYPKNPQIPIYPLYSPPLYRYIYIYLM
jgi:hypothetical protein